MNTTFDVREAIKYMFDGFSCKDTNNIIFTITSTGYLLADDEYIDGQIQRFLEERANDTFQLCNDKNLVKWYRPKEVWYHDSLSPKGNDFEKHWYPSTNAFYKKYDKTILKVVKWETEFFPTTYEECE